MQKLRNIQMLLLGSSLLGDLTYSCLNTWTFYLLIKNIWPPSVTSRGTKCACSLERTLMNLLKSATLLRVINSTSLSLRSRGCVMFIRCSLCDHVIHSTVTSSVTKVTSAWIWSSSWIPFTASVRIRASSNGRTSPNSRPMSAIRNVILHFAIVSTSRV